MIIYNVTTSINPEIEQEWLKWMKKVHIPDVVKTGYFIGSRLCRVVGGDEMGLTYAVQYDCESLAKLQQYETKCAPELRQDYVKKFEGKYACFRTILEVV